MHEWPLETGSHSISHHAFVKTPRTTYSDRNTLNLRPRWRYGEPSGDHHWYARMAVGDGEPFDLASRLCEDSADNIFRSEYPEPAPEMAVRGAQRGSSLVCTNGRWRRGAIRSRITPL